MSENSATLAELLAAMNEQKAILAELLALARKSEERQARIDSNHQALRDAQTRITKDLALNGGAIGSALRGRK